MERVKEQRTWFVLLVLGIVSQSINMLGGSYVTIVNRTRTDVFVALVRTKVTKSKSDKRSILYGSFKEIPKANLLHIPKGKKATVKNYPRNASLYDRVIWVTPFTEQFQEQDYIMKALSRGRMVSGDGIEAFEVGAAPSVYISNDKSGSYKFSYIG